MTFLFAGHLLWQFSDLYQTRLLGVQNCFFGLVFVASCKPLMVLKNYTFCLMCIVEVVSPSHQGIGLRKQLDSWYESKLNQITIVFYVFIRCEFCCLSLLPEPDPCWLVHVMPMGPSAGTWFRGHPTPPLLGGAVCALPAFTRPGLCNFIA